jgi:hypothetical protein
MIPHKLIKFIRIRNIGLMNNLSVGDPRCPARWGRWGWTPSPHWQQHHQHTQGEHQGCPQELGRFCLATGDVKGIL